MFSFFKKKAIIHLYTICWNEEYMLKYFFKHYDNLVERYVVYDDGSTDQTLEILEKHPKVEIRRLSRPDGVDSYVLAAQKIHNESWKESRGVADWVVTTAVDELLYIPNFSDYLTKCTKKGVTLIPALGFQMISATLPSSDESLLKLVKRGCPWSQMNKLSVFDPNKIAETNQAPGRHAAQPIGDVNYPTKDELLLLHYQYLSFERTFNRRAELHKKLGSVDKERRWGFEYGWEKEKFREKWDYFENNSIQDVLSRNYHPDLEHSPRAERWWRKNDFIP